MNLFTNFFRKEKKYQLIKSIEIIAPLSGKIVDITKVPDPVFSKKIVGDGIAINPSGDKIVAPFDGTIGKIFKTLHAFSIKSNDGIELFVHFGIDTVQLKGNGFIQIAKENQIVKQGDIIITYNLLELKQTAKSILTPVVISNMDKIKKIKKNSGMVIAGKTIIMTVKK